MQTKTFSLIEAITSTLIGFIVSLIVQLIIYSIMDIRVTITQNLTITTVFTIVSIFRGYLVRRFFNKIKY